MRLRPRTPTQRNAQCADRLQRRWYTLDRMQLKEVAIELWQAARLRGMAPAQAGNGCCLWMPRSKPLRPAVWRRRLFLEDLERLSDDQLLELARQWRLEACAVTGMRVGCAHVYEVEHRRRASRTAAPEGRQPDASGRHCVEALVTFLMIALCLASPGAAGPAHIH